MRINWRKGAEKSVKGYLAVCLMEMDEYKLMQLTERQRSTRMLALTPSSSLNKTRDKKKRKKTGSNRRGKVWTHNEKTPFRTDVSAAFRPSLFRFHRLN